MDIPLRFIIIGQLVLIVLVVLIRGPRAIAVPLILLKASIVAFLIRSSPELYAAVGFLQLPVVMLCWFGAYFVWYCAYALFRFERPAVWIMLLVPSATVFFCSFSLFDANAPIAARALSLIASLIAVFHALISVVRGSLDDLSEPRRRFRLCFVGCTTVLTAIVLALELAFVGAEPDWLPMVLTVIVGLGVMLVGVPLLLRPDDLLPDSRQAPEPVDATAELDLGEQRLQQKLLQAMENRAYARTGLTIRNLADELSLPEHQLRKLINSRLGYKNFSTFLNGYRIDEARTRLANPDNARTPILTIALDAGFASIAPFNRAFKDAVGKTPSEYRRQHLQPADVVTALRQKQEI